MKRWLLLLLCCLCFSAAHALAQNRIVPLTATRSAAEATAFSAYRANPLTLRVTLDKTRPTATGLESIVAEIRTSVTDTTTALASVSLINPTGTGPFDISFSGAQLNQDLAGKASRALWLVIYSRDDAGETLDVWHAGKLTLIEHGASLAAPAPPNVVGVATTEDIDELLALIEALEARIAVLEAEEGGSGGTFTYLQPGGVYGYRQPGGTGLYLQP